MAVILALQGDHHDFAADIGFGFLDRLILLRAKASRKMKRSSLVGYLSLAALLLTPLRIAGQTGELRVVVATSGSRVDANGYIVAIDTLRRSVAADDSVVFTNVKLGIQTAELLDVAEACIIPEGNPRKVVVRLSVVAELQFDVVCVEGADEPSAPQGVAEPSAPQEPAEAPARQDEPPETRFPTPSPSTMGDFSVGQWVAEIEPPGFPSYPVNMTLYSEQAVGETVGRADYESASWSCSYDLILESAGTDDLVVVQQLSTGDCPDGIRVVLTRQGDNVQAEWLHSDDSLWFEAVFVRSD